MIDLIITVLLLSTAFICGIALYSIGMKCTVEESSRAFRKLIKDVYMGLFKDNNSKPILRLGTIDGVFNSEQIDLIFKNIVSLFEVCFFKCWREKDLVTLYFFKAKNPLHASDTLDLLDLVRDIVEEQVSKILKLNGIYTNTDNYVATHYKNNILTIAVAKNEDGFNIIQKYRQKTREDILSFNENNTANMTENWVDYER
ncbi:hypothetical protein PMY56_03620 [Clostridium tertium]|uniref:hypothetical protein n=1 Tax=Clostridium tertium TaxID=1559 RepID=UPI00232B899C|nr:hypothetical protein [Clostridium tertium]MDB1921084.1 hypothetical protein [Clostridium tertium]MDB1925218.1 hypothetical protein [Clostridium tertium]MDB1930304.1 hypothetical protein [Clostridium tertium]